MFFIIFIVASYLIARFTNFGSRIAQRFLPVGVLKFLMLKEKYTSPLLMRSSPELTQRYEAAINRALTANLSLMAQYAQIPVVEQQNISNLVSADMKRFYQDAMMKSDEFLETNTVDTIINSLKTHAVAAVKSKTNDQVANEFSDKIDKEIRPGLMQIMSFSMESNDYSIAKLAGVSSDIKDKLFDFHFRRDRPDDKQIREVVPYEMRKQKLDTRKKIVDTEILGVINHDMPMIRNNKSLLPMIGDAYSTPFNLELANLLASNRRYYRKPTSTIRSRGPDTRPLPKAIVDQIMARKSSRDPNSLQQSVEFDPVDILESGRGHSGNEYIDSALDQLYKESDIPFVHDFEKIADVQEGIVDRGQVDDIVSDIKIGGGTPFGHR